jgi:hypothetical protein
VRGLELRWLLRRRLRLRLEIGDVRCYYDVKKERDEHDCCIIRGESKEERLCRSRFTK